MANDLIDRDEILRQLAHHLPHSQNQRDFVFKLRDWGSSYIAWGSSYIASGKFSDCVWVRPCS